jgi:hypothetical protein
MATPFIAMLVTLVDVIVRDKDPAEETSRRSCSRRSPRLFAGGRRSGCRGCRRGQTERPDPGDPRSDYQHDD